VTGSCLCGNDVRCYIHSMTGVILKVRLRAETDGQRKLAAGVELTTYPSRRDCALISSGQFPHNFLLRERPLCAMCGRRSVGKDILMFCPSVGAAMCAAC